MFQSITSQLGALAMAAVCLFAVIRGRWPERTAAITLAINWIGCEVLEDWRHGHKPQPYIFAIDVAYAALMFWLLIKTRRVWVLFGFAYQGLIVLTHVAAAIDPDIDRPDFFNAYFVWSYGVLLALAAGVAFEARRRPPPAFPPRRMSPS